MARTTPRTRQRPLLIQAPGSLPMTRSALSDWQDKIIDQQMSLQRQKARQDKRQLRLVVWTIVLAIGYVGLPCLGSYLFDHYQRQAAVVAQGGLR